MTGECMWMDGQAQADMHRREGVVDALCGRKAGGGVYVWVHV